MSKEKLVALQVNNSEVVKLNEINTNLRTLIDLFYPVSSIYLTIDSSFNPNTAWGVRGLR